MDGSDGTAENDPLHAELRCYEGTPAATGGIGKDPVNAPMIRHWCEALGHPVPPDGAAPATMLQVWTMGGLSGHEGRTPGYDDLLGRLDEAGYAAVVATDCEQEYAAPLRPGQRITFDAVVESVSPRKSTKLGAGYFVTTRTEVRADGVLAGTHRFRILKYAPTQATSVRDQAPAPAPARTKSATRPRPVVNSDNAPYWRAIREDRRLLIQRCTGCGALRLPWLPGCNACGSPDWDTVPASGTGTVFSYVVMHHPPFPAFDPPYSVALVELAEGVRLLGNVIGVPYDKVRIGAPVVLDFLDADDDLTVPAFRAVDTEPVPPEPAGTGPADTEPASTVTTPEAEAPA
ncbi:bifunctional MaoC family dehydratase N-terminal/OB-fold nucleic acid binding domain-containing protein [Streptomyces sp. CBMA29]|uniref:bifunctional MaoC family dehydratase N-terminal/OB-fold nucleic acid binding domain-containing protein n=1 Tax=Streptomyces sp. CBMA29 TaxID=1896314 RepID=UPI001661F2AC|nr:OB-fold domain-containing protein [Streptomyces sp. CBMA29]MBD0736164.1 hypothetical protein [Streptomyces sp. CBMA29]